MKKTLAVLTVCALGIAPAVQAQNAPPANPNSAQLFGGGLAGGAGLAIVGGLILIAAIAGSDGSSATTTSTK